MLKTEITIEYDGFVSKANLGRLLMLAASFDNFSFLEVSDPSGESTYACHKRKNNED